MTTPTTIPEQFNRLPEPWRSKAIAWCEAYYGKKLDEIDTIFHELDGKPFGFLQCAFPWCGTPEGRAVWEAISERGEFPPSAPPHDERIANLESRIAVLEGLVTKPEAREGQPLVSPQTRASAAATLALRVGGKYRTRDGRTAVVEQYENDGEWPFKGHVTPPTAGPDGDGDGFRSWRPDGSQAYDRTRESRTDLVEEIVEEPAPPTPPHDEATGDTSDGEGYPSTPPDPGPGYRLLQKGDPIVRGKAEAWHPDEGWYLGPVRGWEGDTFDPNTDYWFREPAPPVDPGPGYRLVEKGELIEEGDEWFECDGIWHPTELGGSGARKNIDTPLRRRVAPPSYRLLNPGETIRASDEVYLYGKWKEMAGDNGVGETFDPEEDYPIRRRIKSYEDA